MRRDNKNWFRGFCFAIIMMAFGFFISSVSVPAVTTGFQLISHHIDVQDYESDPSIMHNEKFTALIAEEHEQRLALNEDSNATVQFMATHEWPIWMTIFIFGGVLPIIIMMLFIKKVYNRIQFS